jgi:hypothetical protein
MFIVSKSGAIVNGEQLLRKEKGKKVCIIAIFIPQKKLHAL